MPSSFESTYEQIRPRAMIDGRPDACQTHRRMLALSTVANVLAIAALLAM